MWGIQWVIVFSLLAGQACAFAHGYGVVQVALQARRSQWTAGRGCRARQALALRAAAPTPEEMAAAFLKSKGVEIREEQDATLSAEELSAFVQTGGCAEKVAQALDGKMRPMEAQPLEKEVEWLREMLGNAQKEIAALNQSAAEARADRADELLRALLAAKSEAAALKGEVAGLQERLEQERLEHAAEITALKKSLGE